MALLPLRFFLGGMLLYAGIDKLLDPAFLHSTGAGSIGQQLDAFTRVSPLTPLIQIFAQPFPVLVGLVIALAEIAVGLGALTGVLYRVSAAGGVALSLLFWLTASWATRPIYYGADLPYAVAWLTLGLAGHGGLYTLESWFDRFTGADAAPVRAPSGRAVASGPVSQERRVFLRAAALGVLAVAVAGASGVLGRVLRRGGDDVAASTGGLALPAASPAAADPAAPSTAPSVAPSANSGAAASTSAGGTPLGKLSDLKIHQGYQFQDPSTGDPAVIIRLSNSQVVAYDAVCTHQGCTVGYDSASGLLFCPCHGATFDPTHNGEAVGGPTNTPLTNLPLKIDSATGTIILQG